MKKKLIRIVWFFSSQLGLDPRKFLYAIRGFPVFIRDFLHFKKKYSGSLLVKPCLADRYMESGEVSSEYFWQDLFVANCIFNSEPNRHIDVGSRIDGFVGHVASFREIEVFDVRPISTTIPNVIFNQADLMDSTAINAYVVNDGYCDSLSCLHALEHFGLGRYGDPISHNGYELGLTNLSKLLLPSGTLYLSVPVGIQRVEFNANWVFDPNLIIKLASRNELGLDSLHIVQGESGVVPCNDIETALRSLANQHYNLCIFTFRKAV